MQAAEQWGLVNKIVTGDELAETGNMFAEEIAMAAPLAVSYAKRVVNELAEIDRGLKLEAWAQNRLIHSKDFEIGVQAALSKSKPSWKGK